MTDIKISSSDPALVINSKIHDTLEKFVRAVWQQ